MNLSLLVAIYVGIVEWLKKRFKLNGWGVCGVAFPIAIVLSVVWNNNFLHWTAWQTICLIFGIWIIPSGWFDFFKNEVLPWLVWLFSQLIPPRAEIRKMNH
jgi:hypothetical protein